MLRTYSKAKIAKGLSYPVGAQAISAALAGLPQFDEIEIFFMNNLTGSPAKLGEYVQSGAPLRILSGDHWIKYPSVYSDGKEESWTVNVYALPSENKQEAQHCLLESGLPKVREWLARKRTPTEEKDFERIIIEMSFAPINVIVRHSDDYFVF